VSIGKIQNLKGVITMVKWVNELSSIYKEVEPKYFYRQIFQHHLDEKGAFTKGKYVGIACEITKEKKGKKTIVKRHTITDDLDTIDELLKSENFIIISPISYIGKSRKTENATRMYAFAIEIDDLRVSDDGRPVGLNDLLHHFDIELLPTPNYIVCSGNGVHLYYVFEQPLILFDNVKKSLDAFKKALTPYFWNQYVTKDYKMENIQFESPFQGFRMAGGVTKAGERTRIFEVSTHPIAIEELNRYAVKYGKKECQIDIAYESELTLAEAKEKYPEWYERRIVNKQRKGTWECKRDLYDWWKRKITEGASVGHRYYCLLMLSIYAIKCGRNISEEELIEDAYSFLDQFDAMSDNDINRFTDEDVMDALQGYYDKDLVTYPINSIVYRSGIQIEKNKRNFRKRDTTHQQYRRGIKALKIQLGEADGWDKGGRPDKRQVVQNWRYEHPSGSKAECIRDTGLSKPTVYRWW
jgi:hypothetical protein